ncbi:6-bladed beta-propeller [Methanospirillum stamsii]|nr:6-bladed beta-propeller [Methanospirillum stamsii]
MNNSAVLTYVCIAGICIMAGVLIGSLFSLSVPVSDENQDKPDETVPGIPAVSMVSPGILALSVDDSFIISDDDGQSIYKINQNGTVEWVIDEKAAEPYGFWQISGIGSDRSGTIYLSDKVTSRIYRFNKDGTYLGTWGDAGKEQGEFKNPGSITILTTQKEKDDRILICDSGNNRIQVFNLTGGYVGGFTIPETVKSVIETKPPAPQQTSAVVTSSYVQPEIGANPRFVERTFTVLSSNTEIPVSLQVDRSVYLGAQKISMDTKDIATKNPEEWGPVIAQELSDPTTEETIRDILDTLLYEGNSRSFNEREMVEFIAHFVQQIPLTDESDNRYPVEIIHDKKGNSFDKALLLYSLLKGHGYDVVFLAYPGFAHAGVGIRLKEHVQSDTFRIYPDGNGDEYVYINPDGPSFFGGLATTYKSSDPFVLHLSKPESNSKTYNGYNYSLYVVESIIKLYEKYQFLVNKEKEVKGDDAKKVRNNYQKIKNVLDYIEKNPMNTEGAYMRIKNSKVNDIIV